MFVCIIMVSKDLVCSGHLRANMARFKVHFLSIDFTYMRPISSNEMKQHVFNVLFHWLFSPDRDQCFLAPWTRWLSVRRRHFQMHFVNETLCVLIRMSLKFVPEGPIDNNSTLVLVMTLASSRLQAIIWTNADRFTNAYMRHKGEMS